MRLTRRMFNIASVSAGVSAGALTLTGCGASTALTDLEAVLTLAEIAFAAVEGVSGLSAPVVTMINGYLNSVSSACAQASALIPSDGIVTPTLAVQIGALFVSAVAPNLPPGVPQEIVQALASIAPAILAFLKSIGVVPASSAKLSNRASVTTTLKGNLSLSSNDLVRVRNVHARAIVLSKALKAN